jgi:predicted GNAT superfamily acetyltransferase
MATGQTAGNVEGVKSDSVSIRMCHELDDMRAAVALQKEIWNFSDLDLVPLRLFVVAEKVGGQVIGAFAGARMVGFALSVPGVRGGHAYLHSHMLGVHKDYRNGGLGRKIKLFQRDEAMERGFDLIEWTFDPLEIKNAWLNIEKLGAIVRRYTINQYGITSSPLQGGLPTDRLIAEWWLKSHRVKTLLEAGVVPDYDCPVRISVPAPIYEWKASPETRTRAKDIQDSNRMQFLKSFAEGLAVLRYERDDEDNGKFLLGAWDEPWSYASHEP